ncbi:MAG: hypothetical protein JWR04_3077 [Rhodoglobus sp.]|nr:hypothetical protein [Rhodoglobus sp.]
MHGNELTWEGHLAVVERLEKWPVDEIADFHASLLEHLIDGTWTRTSINRVLELDDGSRMNRGPNPWTAAAERAGPDSMFVPLRDQVDRALAIPGSEVVPEIPDGHIGLPLHPWTGVPGPQDSLRPAAVRRAVIAAVNEWRLAELQLVLRAAPWAYYRSTGVQLPGVLLTHDEAKYEATQPSCNWSRLLEVSRGAERVELVQLYLSFTGADINPDATEDLAKALRNMVRATVRVVGEPLRVEGNIWAPGGSDGQLVRRGKDTGSAEPNSLLTDVRVALSTSKGAGKHTAPLPDVEFWALLNTLGDERDDWEALTTALSRKAKATILRFHEALAAKLYALDLPELFAVQDGEFPMSEDVFLYTRCAIVAAGRAAYERVLGERALRQDDWGEGEAEALLSVAPEAFGLRTGEELDHETVVSYETGSNPAWGEETAGDSDSPFAGYSVRSVLDGEEEIRFWRTGDRAVAIARQRSSVPGDVDVDGIFGLIDHATLPTALSRSGVHYIRARSAGDLNRGDTLGA